MVAASESVRSAGAAKNSELSEFVCWSRMQAEAGQALSSILMRKELERVSGAGTFFWGVGNPPNRIVRNLAIERQKVDLVLSVMKTQAKRRDVAPTKLVVWRRYIDFNGDERSLPRHVLLTSRGDTASGEKRSHYALMCYAKEPLRLGDYGAFDPNCFRNAGRNAGAVAPSQVTALLKRVAIDDGRGSYRINVRADLTGSYWVKLTDPVCFDGAERDGLLRQLDELDPRDVESWLVLVSAARRDSGLPSSRSHQLQLF